MVKFKVTPVSTRNGSKAPYYVISVKSDTNQNMKKLAEKEARQYSRLASFEIYNFETEKI